MKPFRVFSLIFVVLLSTSSAWAEERIVSFHSDITVLGDGALDVTETIVVDAEGVQIRRGIFRDFPTKYEDGYGNHRNISFEVVSVERDGLDEGHTKKSQSKGIRIYIGKANFTLPRGRYSYAIRYHTDRQLGFFKDHDELYWNVTGTGWDFPIEKASATVHLPTNVKERSLTLTAFTGPQGSRATEYKARPTSRGAEFETTQPLKAREGLTIVVGFPKGVVEEPSNLKRAIEFVSDNIGFISLAFALLASLGWLIVSWFRVGRDPKPGVLFARYEPPAGYSPASARFIQRMGYDDMTFTAAILNLAVAGHLCIAQDDSKKYRLEKLSSMAPFSPGEAVLLQTLFRKGATVAIRDTNHQRLRSAQTVHESALAQNYEDIYFKKNAVFLFPSVAISVLAFALAVVTFTLTGAALVTTGLILVVHIVFAFLLRTPTARGRQMLDELEGFRLYLEVAEGDALKNPPEKTPQLYEKYLPYAVALGVESAWESHFAFIFRTYEQRAGHAYAPAWYVGGASSKGFGTAMSSSFAGAIASASTPPGSSSGVSGGGGGFSGGGGGGGGGGGW